MGRHTYRVYGQFDWQGQSGNAILALSNILGSGKKVIIDSIEVNPFIRGAQTTVIRLQTGVAGEVAPGEPVTISPMDTDSTLLGVFCYKNTSYTTAAIKDRVQFYNQKVSAVSAADLGTGRGHGKLSNNSYAKSGSPNTGMVINQNESFVILPDALNVQHAVLDVNVQFVQNNNNYTVSCKAVASGMGSTAILAIKNTTTDPLRITHCGIEVIGTTDTPYLQVVPCIINSSTFEHIDKDVTSKVIKYDTDSPSPDMYLQLFQNAMILPLGLPESYIAGGSTGTPKGFNFLHTKDFIGNSWCNIFPECCNINTAGKPDNIIANNHKGTIIKQNITLRSGESIAIVSAAETAVIGANNFVGTSGWAAFEFGINFTVENAVQPYLTLTGLQNGTEVRILNSGTVEELSGLEEVSDGVFSWGYEYGLYESVDIIIHHVNYEIIRLTNIGLNDTGLSIPIQQRIDRVYSNT